MNLKERQEKLETVSRYDRTSLERSTVVELRDLAVGLVANAPRLKKAELVSAILEATEETRQRLHVIETAPIELPKEGTGGRAEVIYSKLKEAAMNATTREEMQETVSMIFVAHWNAEQAYVPTSRRSNRTTVMETLKNRVAEETHFVASAVETAIAFFRKLYSAAIAQDEKNIAEAYAAKVSLQNSHLKPISALALIETAYNVLKNPEDHHWTEVSKALALVTGRRSAEIHCSAQFDPVDDGHVLFSGQLKTKGRAVAPYEIPTLVNSDLVIRGLDHLTAKGRRYNDTKTSDNKVAKPLSRAMAIDGENKLTYKDYRALYAAIAEKTFNDGTKSQNAFFKDILGHSEDDLTTASSYIKNYLTESQKEYQDAIEKYKKP